MKVFWMIMAAVGGVAAVVLVLRDDYEMAFVAAAGGAVCWFLSYRQQLSASLPKDEEDGAHAREEPGSEDEEPDEEVR